MNGQLPQVPVPLGRPPRPGMVCVADADAVPEQGGEHLVHQAGPLVELNLVFKRNGAFVGERSRKNEVTALWSFSEKEGKIAREGLGCENV